MRNKLQTFTEFTNTLLPHETAYLLQHEQFEDDIRRAILQRVDFNCRNINQFTPYDTNIDKRKYSNLKRWIQERLEAIDVDQHFAWMSQLDQKIMTDTIAPEEEKALLRAVRRYEYPTFFFRKFYEVLLNYRQFLLIRMRYGSHQLVDDFIRKYQAKYQQSNQVAEQMHTATQDIVQQYAQNESESDQWAEWLSNVFYDEEMDGLNRLFALIRQTFIGFNYRRFDGLLEKYQYLDQQFLTGKYYSKRLLLNYYSNRLLLHSKFQEYDQAIYYGKLSVRAKNHDSLFYATNLAAVQLRLNKADDALQTMKEAYPEMKTTPNLHAKIGFVAFYIKCLNQNGLYKNAENYATSFLHAYKKEVLEYRWHIFFSAYLESLLEQEQYDKVLRVIRQNRLHELEGKYAKRANYLPTITWYHLLAQYKEGILKKEQLQGAMQGFLETVDPHSDKTTQVRDLLHELQPHIPDIVRKLDFQPANPG